MKSLYNKSRRATYNLIVHIVFVTKYRHKVLNNGLLTELEQIFMSVLEKWDASLVEFNGESDHVHLLVSYPPHKLLSSIISNLKSTATKSLWNKHRSYLQKYYWKGEKVLWTRSYFVASCGGVTIDQLKEYVQQQNRPE